MPEIITQPNTADRIVVGYDGSRPATDAVAYAAQLARQRERTLLIIMASAHLNPKNPQTARALAIDEDYILNVRTRMRRKLESLYDKLTKQHPDRPLELALVADDPAGALAEASRDAYLVVVGARGITAGGRSPVLGQVSNNVVTHAHGPVMVVPEGAHALAGNPVMVGLQDAPESIAAAELAFQEADVRGVPLVLCYVWDQSFEYQDFEMPVEVDVEEVTKSLDHMLTKLAAPMAQKYPNVKVSNRVLRGRPTDVLAAASTNASLLVIGSRGLGGFRGLLLGSTSRHLVRLASCPVLIVRKAR